MIEKYEDCPSCTVQRVNPDERDDDVTIEVGLCDYHDGASDISTEGDE